MPPFELTLEEKSAHYRISQKRYLSETKDLLKLGFTQQQADQLILRKSSINTVQLILLHANTLLTAPYLLSFEQITRVGLRKDGIKTIKTAMKSYQPLLALGFSNSDIVLMMCNGGAFVIKTALSSYQKLRKLELSHEEIVSIALNGGAQSLETILSFYQPLKNLSFNHQQIIMMTSNVGGLPAMRRFLKSYGSLQKIRCCNYEMVNMLTKGGIETIDTVLECYVSLQALGYNHEKIVSIAANGGSPAIRAALCSDLPLDEMELFKHFCADLEEQQDAVCSDEEHWRFDDVGLSVCDETALIQDPSGEANQNIFDDDFDEFAADFDLLDEVSHSLLIPSTSSDALHTQGFFATQSHPENKRKQPEDTSTDRPSKRAFTSSTAE